MPDAKLIVSKQWGRWNARYFVADGHGAMTTVIPASEAGLSPGVAGSKAVDDGMPKLTERDVEGPPHLPRRLGVVALAFLIVAFNAPIATMAGFAQLAIGFGNGVGAPVSFLIAGAILMVFAVGFVGMGRYIANPGAFYQFIVAGVDRSWGLAGAFLATAAYMLLCAGSYLYMGLVAADCLTRMTGHSLLSGGMWSLVFLIALTIIGFLRIDLSMKILGKLVCLEVGLVAIWEAAIIARGGPEGYALVSFTPSAFLSGSPGLGILFAMLCMVGIEAGACFSAETRNPEVAVGRATYLSIGFMALFYGLGTWLYIVTQGASKVVISASTNPVGSFFGSVQAYLGTFFVHVASLTLITSQMAAINSVQGSASRYLFALGRDGVLPRVFARVHYRLESPYVAVSAVSVFSLAILAVVSFFKIDPVASYAAMTGMGIYFLLPLMIATSVSVIFFYRKNRQVRTDVWVQLIAPTLSSVALTGLFVLTSLNLATLVGTHVASSVAITTVFLIPLAGWFLARFFSRHRPEIYQRIGNQ